MCCFFVGRVLRLGCFWCVDLWFGFGCGYGFEHGRVSPTLWRPRRKPSSVSTNAEGQHLPCLRQYSFVLHPRGGSRDGNCSQQQDDLGAFGDVGCDSSRKVLPKDDDEIVRLFEGDEGGFKRTEGRGAVRGRRGASSSSSHLTEH